MSVTEDGVDRGEELRDDEHFERAVDNTAWDGNAAMTACGEAACYRAICAGRKSGPPEERGSWALPHHKRPGSPPNAAGVRAALARFSQTQGLTNREEARRHLERHMASVQAQSQAASKPPRENLYRAATDGYELRWADEDHAGMPTLFGHFARFDEWTEINSLFEGRFLERIAPGAFRKTMNESRESIRVLFQHGRDPHIGDKVLGPIAELREDDDGAYYEVPMLDTTYNRDLLPGLEQGLYGASFRFKVVREDVDAEPERSEHNPEGIPERTIREAAVMEFGPVTFPAYAGATAGVRSLTDEFVLDKMLAVPERVLPMIEEAYNQGEGDAAESVVTVDAGERTTSTGQTISIRAGTESHPDDPSTSPEPEPAPQEAQRDDSTKEGDMTENGTPSVEELQERNREISAVLADIDARYGTRQLEGDDKETWDRLNAEHDANEARIKEAIARRERVARLAGEPKKVETWEPPQFGAITDSTRTRDIYDLSTARNQHVDPEGYRVEMRDRAHEAIDRARNFPEHRSRESFQDRAHDLVDRVDTKDGMLARRILYTGHPGYEAAFWKKVGNKGLTREEDKLIERAMTTATEGNIAVPFTLDPTVILTSDGSANPLRQISRVETIATHTWKGVASTAMSLGYSGEAVEVGDDSPTLSQPEVAPVRADAFVPFSVELDQDWGQLRTEMTRLIQEGKDDLEATKFALGTGAPEPQGVLIGAGTFTVTTAATAAFAVADLYSLEEDLGPRYRQRASFIGSKFVFNKVRQFDTSGGAALWVRLAAGQPPELIGYPAYEQSEMATALTAGGTILCFGDFSRFLIVDRVGMDVELVPHLFGTANNRPTGQRGFLAIWRNSSVVLNASAFRKLITLS